MTFFITLGLRLFFTSDARHLIDSPNKHYQVDINPIQDLLQQETRKGHTCRYFHSILEIIGWQKAILVSVFSLYSLTLTS